MKRFMTKKVAVVGLVVALVIGVGGAAFAYFTTTGGGTGSAAVGTQSALVIDQLGGTPMYNSTIDASAYQYSMAYYATGAGELGNKINLAGGGGPLSDVVVAMANFDTTPGPMNITLNVYNPGSYSSPGSAPGSLIATDEQSFNIPAAPDGGYYGPICTPIVAANPNSDCGINNFNIVFNFSSQDITLPGTVVYGIQYNDAPNAVNRGVNVQLANETTNISTGSDADPGYLFDALVPASFGDGNDTGPGEITCDTVNTTFGEYPTASCDNGLEGIAPYIPAVEFDTNTMSDLYPGGPAQPISFSVTNPGTIPVTLSNVKIAISTITNQDAASIGPLCDPSWFTITQPSPINGPVAPGQTWVDSSSGASIVLNNGGVDQDACQGATVNLTFTAS